MLNQRPMNFTEKVRRRSGNTRLLLDLSFLGVKMGENSTSTIPTEFQLFPYGTVTVYGVSAPLEIDERAMNRIITKFEERGLDMVVDYEHQTEGGSFSSPDGVAPAAGWITRLINKGKEGLWAAVSWTERAKSLLATKEYRYFSPVYLVSKDNNQLAQLLRVGLTNAPRINNLRPIVASMNFASLDSFQIEVSSEVFTDGLHHQNGPGENQRYINKLLGVSDAIWAKHQSAGQRDPDTTLVIPQTRINEMLGLSEETWRKHNS